MKKGDRIGGKDPEITHEMRIILRDGSTFLQYDSWDRLIALACSFSGQYKKLTMKPVAGMRDRAGA